MWLRRKPDRRERLLTAGLAAAAGLAVGAATLYLSRIFVRERVTPRPGRRAETRRTRPEDIPLPGVVEPESPGERPPSGSLPRPGGGSRGPEGA